MRLKNIQRLFWFHICVFSMFYTILITKPTIPYIFINPYFNYRDIMNTNYIEKKLFVQYIQSKLDHTDCFILKNDYPYKVNAEHYVIWLKNHSIDERLCVHNDFPHMTEFKIQENPWWLKSIPQIRHCHLFIPYK